MLLLDANLREGKETQIFLLPSDGARGRCGKTVVPEQLDRVPADCSFGDVIHSLPPRPMDAATASHILLSRECELEINAQHIDGEVHHN